MSALANETFIEAAISVRDKGGRASDVRTVFHRFGNSYAKEISFEAEMIIPPEGVDDLGQTANASITFVRYSISLAYRQDQNIPSLGVLELLEEKLEHIKRRDATKHLRFPHDSGKWRKSVLQGRRTSPFIATEIDGDTRIIKLSQDAIQGGRPKKFFASKLPRTVLSTVNTTESPTALLVRREMQSWRLLQLEPAALREPDKFDSLTPTPRLSADGTHLPATLYFLAQSFQKRYPPGTHTDNFAAFARYCS